MSIFDRLFGKPNPQDVFQMPDDPGRFIAELSKRKLWCDIDRNLLDEIGRKAEGNMLLLKGFVFVSECHGLIEKNFLPLTQNPNCEEEFGSHLIAFACTLSSLGGHLCDGAKSVTDAEQLRLRGCLPDWRDHNILCYCRGFPCTPLAIRS